MVSQQEYEQDPTLGKYGGWCKKQNAEITLEELSDKAVSLWKLYLMWRSRYPFDANDLTIDEWRALGWMDMLFSRIDQERFAKMIFGEGDR